MNGTDLRTTAARSGCYAVKVKSRSETAIGTTLRTKGYEVLVPTYKDRRTYSDRIKTVDSAMFPGYLFVHMDADRSLPLVSTEGVHYIVKSGNALQPLSPEEVEILERLCTSKIACETGPSFNVGQRVRIDSGPLAGLEGTLVRTGDSTRLILSIRSIFSSVTMDLRETRVTALSD
jgi:transcription antitermination factor NusG